MIQRRPDTLNLLFVAVTGLFLVNPASVFALGISDPAAPESRIIQIDTGSGASEYPVNIVENSLAFDDPGSPKVLIVHADPHENSLSSAARDHIAAYLEESGWEVVVRSLYREGFDPVVKVSEIAFTGPAQAETDPAVAEYQQLIRSADALVLVYPLWWKQPPAILKGWEERVFTYGYAYEFVDRSPESVVSLLAGRKLLIINVVAHSREMYRNSEDQRFMDHADRALFGSVGMEFAGRHIIYSSTSIGMDEKRQCLEELENLVPLIEKRR